MARTIKEIKLKTCPHCKAPAELQKEGVHYSNRYKKKVPFARVLCSESGSVNHLEGRRRCLCKTIAAPLEEVVEHWNMRA
jgi:hypothetical protein